MSQSEKTRKIVVLAAGAAVGLSATAIVLLHQPGNPGERLTSIQSALRQGASATSISGDRSKWMQMAKCSTCSDP